MGFILGPAFPDDIDEIMRIENESFPDGIREEREVFQDRLAAFPEGNLALVRDPHGRLLAGYFSSEIWESVPPPESEKWNLGHSARESHSTEGTVLYVSSFAVEPASRGAAAPGGTGTFLFNASIAHIAARFPRLRKIAFIVHRDWSAARHIYEKEGFRYAGSIPGFFPENGTAFIMEKPL